MRDYGLMPWNVGDLTDDEWVEILAHQNVGWDLARAANAEGV